MEYGEHEATAEQSDDYYDPRYDIETDDYWTFSQDEDECREAALEHHRFLDEEVF